MLIENTRARFGDYTFYLQTFNAAHEAGAVQELKARSGAMPASYTEKSRTQVSLIVDQLSCNYPDASEGNMKILHSSIIRGIQVTRMDSLLLRNYRLVRMVNIGKLFLL